METRELHVKKLENPDFSNLNFKGRNLMMHRNYSSFPIEFHIGEVKLSHGNHRGNLFYLDGFTMAEATVRESELEKQTILGREYCGHHAHYEMPLLFDRESMKYNYYEFKEDVNIDELRDICDGKKQRLMIKEDK